MHDLTDEQKKFLDANGNIVLHACPGSGKTFVVAQKLMQYINGWSRPHQGVAVLSFTNVASEEIQKQASEFGSNGFQIEYPHYVGTLDSFINSFILLRFGYLMMDEPKRPTIAIKDIFSVPYSYWRKECRKKGCPDDIQSFRWGMDGQLYRKKEKVVCPPNPKRKHPPCYDCKQVLLKRGFIFQSEVAALSYLLLKKHPEIAVSIASRFPILLIDEAQDTSVEQMAVLDQLSQAGVESMILVGDPDQSIYEWRDATPECFVSKMNCDGWTTFPLTAIFVVRSKYVMQHRLLLNL